MELEISVLTLLVLVGLILSLSSIYIQVAGYQRDLTSAQKKLDGLNSDIDSARRQLEASKKIDMTVFVDLDGVDSPSNMPKVEDLVGSFTVRDQNEPKEAFVSRGVEGFSIRLNLKGLTADTLIERLEVLDQKTRRTWIRTNFYPLNPTYNLKSEISQAEN